MTQRVGATIVGAGKGPAGFDPVSPYASAPSLAIIPEVQYLGQTADYNGISADPIDVDVALSLAIPQGSCRHAPELGHLLYSINPLGNIDENQKATDLVYQSNPLARRLAAGDVSIVVVLTDSSNGQLKVEVHYRNLRNNPSQILTATGP